MKLALIATLTLLGTSAVAQSPNWSRGAPVTITVTNDRFIPDRIILRSGRTYIMRLRNRSNRTHSFSAPTLFKYARVSATDRRWIANDEVKLKPGASATVHLVAPDTPNARYDFRSTRLGDAAEKMKGAIYIQ
jgi:hypothetical protein